ncbi:hypothetical protein [Tabrizicola sp.]|uniref:hypothetical protein n=1 Tax=Tabrizicola sp. TaxID=2005166 RepID=UPI0035B2A7AD
MRLAPLLLLPLLAACAREPAPAAPYPFTGSWDCGVATFRFTNTSYFNGSRTYPIRAVTREGDSYTLYIQGGTRIVLALVTDTGLTWVSAASGDQLNCRRVN